MPPGSLPRDLVPPPVVPDLDAARSRVAADGFAIAPARAIAAGLDPSSLDALAQSWNDLPPDAHLRDGGRYRYRRHGCFTLEPGATRPAAVPHRAHWQPTDYNALHGGFERWFEPIVPAVATSATFLSLVARLGDAFRRVRDRGRWYVEAHQFRIDTATGIGRPTPEGAHRDGVEFVAVVLVQRRDVRGGETRVFDADGPTGVRFTMQEPWSALLLDDTRVIHETTPIQPAGDSGVRDTLVLTYRAEGFQVPHQGVGL
jgi:hypothetical protein